MKPTDKQIQWFWEQCGLDFEDFYLEEGYTEPDIDLNNLFKYAVPIALGKLCESRHALENCEGRLFLLWLEEYRHCKDFALALFWAIYKALGGKR